MDTPNGSNFYGQGSYYCGGCGLLRPLIGKCPECVRREHMKNIEEGMERQRIDNERARNDREREIERQQYYARINSPEYQAQLAHQRELERQQEIARQWKIAEARRIEQERWNALTPEEQAAEIELKNKRQQLADAKLELEREKHAREKQQSDNFNFGLKTVLWVGYAGLLYWVFASLLPAMAKSLGLLILPVGAMVILLTGVIGVVLFAFSANKD